MKTHRHDFGCGCDGHCDRREFLALTGAALGGLMFTSVPVAGEDTAANMPVPRASVRVVFLYPPSQTFADNPDGWWSWPGNEFDAEGRQQQYTTALHAMQDKLGIDLVIDQQPIANADQAQTLTKELAANRPDGLLLVMFYNNSLSQADLLLEAAEKVGIPVVFYIGLGVKHGPVRQYQRPGVYFIQSLDNFEAIEFGLRMIGARYRMAHCRLLSITEATEMREGVEPFLGTTVRVIPFDQYADEFHKVPIDAAAHRLISQFTAGATEQRGITPESLENAARAHLAIKKLLADNQAQGLTMNCLRRGMLKPCMSFATLNSELIPAACENDFPALYTQMLGTLLTGRPGFQHNPCYDTEKNHYYGSHCTCSSKLYGPDGPALPYLLRRFAHTNEGSCAIQVFWKEAEPVTMVRYHPGEPPALDVYAGKVIASHPMPPAAGCTTNVEIEVTDRSDACQVVGHHNLLFCGDFARKFRLFAQLFKIQLADTGYTG